MQKFSVNVLLSQGLTRLNVNQLLREQWFTPNCPEFVIEFFNGKNFTTIHLQLEQGVWYDQHQRLPENEVSACHFKHEDTLNQAYVQNIGQAISRFLILNKSAEIELFASVLATPALN